MARRKTLEELAGKSAADILTKLNDFGENLANEDLLDQPFELTGYEVLETGFGPAIKVSIVTEDGPNTCLTWSEVILKQVLQLEPYFPVPATLRKVKQYFTLA